VKSKGYSTTAVSEGAMRARSRALGAAARRRRGIEIVRDAGERVTQLGATTCSAALVEGALLTVLVVFVFLNSWRSTVITGLALPVSVLASFVPLLALGSR
jgi:HAE1 family hydrophobic/amphiphilic exporter-1